MSPVDEIVGLAKGQIYTVSLNFRKTQASYSGRDLAIGYLDDSLIVSFGLNDKSSHFVEVGVAEVLQNHYSCDDLMREPGEFRGRGEAVE
jgi:hypothetical protein